MSNKKSFKDNINPAMQFISTPEEVSQQLQKRQEKPPKGYKLNPLYVETKSKRMQLLMQPSLFEKIKKQAKINGTSINEYIHSVLERDTKKNEMNKIN